MTPVGVTIIVNPLYSTDFLSLSFFAPSSFPYCQFVCFSFDFVFFFFVFFLFIFSYFVAGSVCLCVYTSVCVCSPTSPRSFDASSVCGSALRKTGKRQKGFTDVITNKGLQGHHFTSSLCLLLLPCGIYFANLYRRAKFRLVPSLTGCSSLFFPSVFSVKCKSVCSCDDA